jgi:ankyrin repeat protein
MRLHLIIRVAGVQVWSRAICVGVGLITRAEAPVMIASEQDKDREGDADAVGLDASTDQQQAIGAKSKQTHSLANDTRSDNAAFVAAIEANDIAAMARAVLEEGMSVTAALGDDGSTPLHFAAQLGHVASMEWLVGQGADVHAKSEGGSTPLHEAAHQGQMASMEWLVGHGADVYAKDKTGHSPVHFAAHSGKIVSLEWLVGQGADIHAESKTGTTALHFAAHQGQVATMKWLVGQGAGIHALDENGCTPFHDAAYSGQVVSLEWLAGQGADVHTRSKNGNTALHQAAYTGQVASMEFLARQGVDIHTKNKDGHTALHLAEQVGQMLAVAWLGERGALASTGEPTPAETVATEILSLPPTIAVVGVDEGYSGLYKKQQHTDGRVLYKSTWADSKQAIWYDTDEYGGIWCLGEVGSDGTYGMNGMYGSSWFAVAMDTAISPLNIEAAWHELAWEPCSNIRVTKSRKKHTKVIEVKGMPNNFGVGGKYRPQAQSIDGRPTYKGGPDSGQVIWYSASAGSWRIGPVMFAGTSRYFMHAKDTAATPNTVKTPWCLSTEYSLPNPCAKIILPSVKVAGQEVPRQMQLKMPKMMTSDQMQCLGCGHQYTSQAEVVFHEECLHHHCVCCRDKLNGPSCAVCAEAMIDAYLENEEREDV